MEHLRMAGDPANISCADKFIIGVDVEHILDRQSGTKEIAASGVNDSLGLACRS